MRSGGAPRSRKEASGPSGAWTTRPSFGHALEKVDRLEEIGQPWFLTLLTVGTHHPFVVPPRPELGVLLASTREIRLRSGRVREARLATRVDAVLNRVRTALDWAPRDSRGSLTIEDLRIVVHWP